MRILVISQYYYPEPFKIHEICEKMVEMGNAVTVITGRPNYPEGILYYGYDCKEKKNENINGVKVIRTPISVRGNNTLSLIRNYLSFPKHAKIEIRNLNEEYDIVFAYQLSPVFILTPALYYKKKYGKKVFAYCLDLWPESLKILNIRESSFLYRIIRYYSKIKYQECDHISVTSPSFVEYLSEEHRVSKNKLNYIPQHGENLFLKVAPYRKTRILTITYAGNIGKAQGFDCLIDAVMVIPNLYYSLFKIVVIGSGSFEKRFKARIEEKELYNIFEFEGRKTVEELIPYYERTSLFLLSLEKGSSISKTIPSKLQTYMAAGRGIIGSIDGVSAEIVNDSGSGKVCNAGNVEGLANIIVEMINADDNKIKEMAKNSRNYFLNNFTLDIYMNKVIEKMEDLI